MDHYIDTSRTLPDGSPNPDFDRIFMMYVNFNGNGSKPYVQTAIAHRDGTHSDWTAPVQLPTLNYTNNDTYLLPHVDPDGVVYTPLINYDAENGGCCVDILMDYSKDGGVTWNGPFVAASDVHVAPLTGAGYESKSTGFGNILLTASYDQGQHWAAPIQVNDNASPSVDEFQPTSQWRRTAR